RPRGVDAVRFRRFVLPTLVGAAAYFAIFGGEYSLLDLWRLQRQHERELAELKRLQDSLAVLRARVDSLERDPALIERLGRERYGLIREGERLFLFAEPSDSAPERERRGEQASNVRAHRPKQRGGTSGARRRAGTGSTCTARTRRSTRRAASPRSWLSAPLCTLRSTARARTAGRSSRRRWPSSTTSRWRSRCAAGRQGRTMRPPVSRRC